MPLIPSNAKATFVQSITTQKTFKPCHVGIHWITVIGYSHMRTYVPGLQAVFFFFLNNFVLAKLATSSIKVKDFNVKYPY